MDGHSLKSNPQNLSKGHYNVSLFSAEPPEGKELVKALFHDREQALTLVCDRLSGNMDKKGVRYGKENKKPWIIHGESRSGKSHLARRILAEIPEDERNIQIRAYAKDMLEASLVMRNLFNQILEMFRLLTHDYQINKNVVQKSLVEITYELIEGFERIIGSSRSDPVEITEGFSREVSSDFKADANISGRKAVKLGMQLGQAQKDGQSIQLKYMPPSPELLAELCASMVDTLVAVGLLDHVLILADDVDLLGEYEDPNNNARKERIILATTLKILHETPGIDVIITARTWYKNANKEFIPLIDLAKVPMQSDDLRKLHDLRFNHYVEDNLPKEFLTPEALEFIAKHSNYLPGVFLQHLNLYFEVFTWEVEWGVRDIDWLREEFDKLCDDYRRDEPEALHVLQNAIEKDFPHIDITDENPFQGSRMRELFIFQRYNSERKLFISELASEFLRVRIPE